SVDDAERWSISARCAGIRRDQPQARPPIPLAARGCEAKRLRAERFYRMRINLAAPGHATTTDARLPRLPTFAIAHYSQVEDDPPPWRVGDAGRRWSRAPAEAVGATPETGGWRRARERPSLAEVFGTIRTRPAGPLWRKLLAFLGPGYLVAVGYMDPGNWATSLAGGAKFGYTLLSIALLSHLMAVLLQALCARLGVGGGRGSGPRCSDAFPRAVSWPLWLLAEIAICATDLAEVIGTAIGLNLLFGIPLEIGVIITACDVFLILWLQNIGFRWVEAFIVTLLAVIAVCFAIQIAMADPDWGAVIRGFAPTTEIVTNPDMLYIALGILGATVMPHNLYLHSGVVD